MPQSGVMITWPHADTDWADDLQSVYPVFATIGAAIAERQSLLSVCVSHRHIDLVRSLLLEHHADPARLRFCVARSNDTWARDYGPLSTLVDGRPVVNDFRFNGWGGRFPSRRDAVLTRGLADQRVFGDARFSPRELVLEGGAIESDGLGTLLATRSSVISETRNPATPQHVIEQRLRSWLGFERFLWLEHGHISGDDTDGHIDTLARFANADTILYATAPEDDPDFPELVAMAGELRRFRTLVGRPYRLRPLPFPGIHRDKSGRRLPASYANFLITNHAVLLPVYGVLQDIEAEAIMQRAFPGRRIIPIDCRPIIAQNGSLHCLTMQFPMQIPLHNGAEITAE